MRHAPRLLLTAFIAALVTSANASAQTAASHPAPVAAAPVQSTPPQRPAHAEPFPLPAGAVEFQARSDINLPTTLYLPRGAGPFPAIVIAHGANSPSRNAAGWQSHIGNLLERGYAVAIYDQRGTGDAPGQWVEGPPFEQAAADIAAVADYLATRSDINAAHLGVMGGSRGGWTAPLAAARSSAIKFVIVVSGPSVSPNQSNIFQRGEELRDSGFTDEEVTEINAMRRVVWDYYGTGNNYEGARAAWAAARDRPWFAKLGLAQEVRRPDEIGGENFGYYRRGTYDPTPVLAALKVPTLVVLGEEDRHIPVDATIAGWRAAFRASGNTDATIVLLAKAGHGARMVEGREVMSAISGVAHMLAAPYHPAFNLTVEAWLDHIGNR